MTLEQILHQQYAQNSYLTNLVPASKFVTGNAKNLEPPYITLNREGSPTFGRSNVNRIDQVLMRFQVWASHTVGSEVQQLLISAFENWEYYGEPLRILSMRKSNDLAMEEDDGIWQFVTDFLVTVETP